MPRLAESLFCTGCGACADACAVDAITFVEDADGFARPQVDAVRCRSCGSCTRACPALRADHAVPLANGAQTPDFFAARLRDTVLLDEVSSGGAFWALVRTMFARGGVVYGAAQIEIGHVRHMRAETLEEAKALRRSKYLPSDVRGCYAAVRRDLVAGREVLFAGTGCQVAALNAFLGKAYSGLVTCDVVCHGIPSMLAWRSYRSEKEAAVGKKMVDLIFRDKTLGWKKNQYCITYADGSRERERITTQLFHAGYLRGLFYRPSCGVCPYAALPRVADLTLADFWKYEGPLFSERGVSLVVMNSARGRDALAAAAAYLETERVPRALALASCRHLDEHPEENPKRTAFLAELRRNGYHAAARKFITFPKARRKASLPVRVIRKIGALLRGQRDPDGTRAMVRAYAADLGVTPIFPGTPGGLLRLLLGSAKNALVISGNKRVLELAKRRGFERVPRKKICAAAARNLALRDAFLLLAKKGVSVYFVNRVGKVKTPDWRYAESAARRMERGLNFPTMYENPSAYEADLRELFGEKYSPEYVRGVGRIPQIVQTGGVCRHEDFQSPLVNVVGGLRVTCGQPKTWSRTVHVYGRCGAFGYAVEDSDTLPSQLQHELNARGCTAVRVVNHGLWGGDDDCLDANFLHESAGFRPGDVVLFYRRHLDPRLMEAWKTYGVRYLDITAAWHEDPAAKSCFYDRPGHMNAVGYGLVARLVAADLLATKFAGCPVAAARLENLTTPWLTRYLKQRDTTGFDAELDHYVAGVRALCPPLPPGQTAGAIVMNCNPFTNGHRKLIEQAAHEVDRLYILVVEEDRSVFPFAARFEMVKAGTADLANVVVAPSGRFVISSLTFPEYFMKDYVKEKDFDVSGDVRTFCERIAPPLGITIRFAGAEPFDPVTANYNRSMAELLPQYGLRFREIPRFATKDGQTISATEVRRLLAAGDFVALAAFVPETTLSILKTRHQSKGGGGVNDCLLPTGLTLPVIGYGTFPLKERLVESVPLALRCGYGLIDTSDNYHNEQFIGEGLKRCGRMKTPLIVVTKFSQPLRTGSVARCFEEAERRLGRGIDVYLLHWPYPFLWRRQWREMEELYLAGRVKVIGVCNFDRRMLERLFRFARVKPMIDQFERHPIFQQKETADFCRKQGIRIMSYSPFARMDPRLMENPVLKDIARTHGHSVGQIILRWNIERGDIPIPASGSEGHITENFPVSNFSLSAEELARIDALESGTRVRFDPRRRFDAKIKLKFAWHAIKLMVKDAFVALHLRRCA